jgi:RNA polymerase sigma factor (sigma-70 family)
VSFDRNTLCFDKSSEHSTERATLTTIPDQPDTDPRDDTELIKAVRAADTPADAADAYATLYRRHVDAAYRMATQVANTPADRDDYVSEAFARVLNTLRAGKGPDTAFRAYLLTALRNVAYDRTRQKQRVTPVADVATVPNIDLRAIDQDTVIDRLEQTLAAQAFRRLPERWQTVLWHLEVEGRTPAQTAPLMKLNANSVSALAYRAREALKQQYLQVHLMTLPEDQARECGPTVEKLGPWARDGLSNRDTTKVTDHLADCARCTALAAELASINSALPAFIIPVAFVPAIASNYLPAIVAGGGAASAGAASAGSNTARNIIIGGTAAAIVAAIILSLLPGNEPPGAVAQAPATPPASPPPNAPTNPAALTPPPTVPASSTPTDPDSVLPVAPLPGIVARVIDSGWGYVDNQIRFTVTNISDRPGMGTAVVTFPNGVHGARAEQGCQYQGPDQLNPAACLKYLQPGCDYWAYDLRHLTCQQWLAPGESFTRTIWLGATPESLWTDPHTGNEYIRDVTVPVEATVNEYRETLPLVTRLSYPWQPLAKPVQVVKRAVTPSPEDDLPVSDILPEIPAVPTPTHDPRLLPQGFRLPELLGDN